jgi:hypothetical protein
MTQEDQTIITQAYAAFNSRNIDAVLQHMHSDVHWPNGWEGGYVSGHEAVRDYWTRQWKEINPTVKPLSFKEGSNGTIEVGVHQVVTNLEGQLLHDGLVKHIYTLEHGKIKSMEIEKADL